jgi:hypothetical protein
MLTREPDWLDFSLESAPNHARPHLRTVRSTPSPQPHLASERHQLAPGLGDHRLLARGGGGGAEGVGVVVVVDLVEGRDVIIIGIALLFMLIGAGFIALGPENSWFFAIGLAFIAVVPWMIWFDLRRARKQFAVAAKTVEPADQAKLAGSLEPPTHDPGQFGEGEFRSMSGRWRIVTVVTGATARAEGVETIWSGTCGYRVTDTQGGDTVIEYIEKAEPLASSFRVADDERSIRLGAKEFALPE